MLRKLIGFIALILLSTMLLSTAFAAGKLSVVQENFLILPYSDYHAGYVYAEVKNVGDKPVEFNGGLFELYDAEGNSIESSNYLRCYPEVLNAGETGYLYVSKYVEEAKDRSFIDDYLLTVTGKGSKEKSTVYFTVNSTRLEEISEGYWSYHYITADIENKTDDTQYDFHVVYALKDADGKLLYVDYANPSYVGFKTGTSMEVRVSVDSDVVECFDENGIVPSVVDAIAYVEIEN